MHLTNRVTEEITEADLFGLITNQVMEDKTIEYKSILNISNEEEKKEFLTDISSFANTNGGHIIYGMSEDRGLPLDLVGLEINDQDKEKLRLEDIIRNGISPRITGVSIRIVALKNGRNATIIFVSKSWNAPHAVTYKKSSRFVARHSNGKYQLDMQEIRQAFIMSETITEKIREFRQQRIFQIDEGKTPVPLPHNARLALHCIPVSAFQSVESVNFQKLALEFHQVFSSLTVRKYNLDGLLLYNLMNDGQAARSYVQVFRNGVLEHVDANISYLSQKGDDSSPRLIEIKQLELDIFHNSMAFFESLTMLNLEAPVIFYVSLLGVHNHIFDTLYRGGRITTESGYYIDRPTVLIPELLVENYPKTLDDVTKLVRPSLDILWNSCGYERSLHYNSEGAWRPNG